MAGVREFLHRRCVKRTRRRGAQCGIAPGRGVIRGVRKTVNLDVGNQYRCPCCGYRTLARPEALELCPVCWWEDDGQEDEDASDVRLTVNGGLSLSEARTHFAECGAAHPRFLPYVRKPYSLEM
jgi:hypothetical protein